MKKSHKFTKNYNIPAITDRRIAIERARRLMALRPKESPAMICREVGCGDASDFRRDFQRLYGCTPTMYRKLCRKKELDNSG